MVEESKRGTNGVQGDGEGATVGVGGNSGAGVVDDRLVVLVRAVREVHAD